jgi:dienelactone hydrolase
MKQRPEVKADSIGVLGVSRGGELALLLGATYPELKAVVAAVPSGVIWPGWDPSRPSVDVGSWTYGGHELPFVHANGAEPVYTTDADGRTVERDSPMFLAALDASSASALDAATTRVERTKGPVLLLASADDQLWPSCKLAGIAMDRLTAHGHTTTFADDLVCYPSAGHRLGTPNLPTTDLSTMESSDGLRIALGGTPAGIARAARDAYERKRAFLAAALQ